MFDPRTELLTASGWIAMPDITESHLVAVFDPADATLSGYTHPKSIHVRNYSGHLVALDESVSLRVTPEHRLYLSLSATVKQRYSPVFEVRPANQVLHGRFRSDYVMDAPFRLRRGGAGTRVLHIDFSPFDINPFLHARLMGFFAGDGHASRRSRDVLTFHLKKPRKIDYLTMLCETTNLDLSPQNDKYAVGHPGIGHWYAENLYRDGHKMLPAAILRCSQGILEAVLEGLQKSDGYTRPGQVGFEYATTSPYLVDMMQAIGVLAGQPFSSRYRDGCYRLYTLNGQATPHINDARKVRDHVASVPYVGKVYGIEMGGGLVATRRAGRTLLIAGC